MGEDRVKNLSDAQAATLASVMALTGTPRQEESASGTRTASIPPPESHLSTYPYGRSRSRQGLLKSGVDRQRMVATKSEGLTLNPPPSQDPSDTVDTTTRPAELYHFLLYN